MGPWRSSSAEPARRRFLTFRDHLRGLLRQARRPQGLAVIKVATDARDRRPAKIEDHPQRGIDGHAAALSASFQSPEHDHQVRGVTRPVAQNMEPLPGVVEATEVLLY